MEARRVVLEDIGLMEGAATREGEVSIGQMIDKEN